MKTQTKLTAAFLTIVFLILFLSYKILEPEIRHPRSIDDYELKFEALPFDIRKDDSIAEGDLAHYVGKENETKNEYMLALEEKYSVDMNQPLMVSPWELAASWVKPREIIPEDCPELGAILRSMATSKIIEADVGYKGTQLKMSLILEGGQRVSFKPKWYSRDHVIEGKPYDGADRHNGEIAAFHLARLLGLRRTPLVVGRRVNMEKEIKPVAQQRLLQTFFYNGSNDCFYGICYYCKGKETGVCGEHQTMEGVVILWLPTTFKLKTHRHPWQRTYRENKKARWETSNDYCELVKRNPALEGTRLLDIIDTTILDYLIGNADRHHYETLSEADDAMLLIMDNAKSFGDPYYDERSILAPLYQCCIVRKALYDSLEQYPNNMLGYLLKRILSADPISPVLSDAHYSAIDRRLKTIQEEINKCIELNGATQVLIEDR